MLTYLLISYFLPLMNISKREVSRLASKKPDAALISKMSSRKNNNNRPTSIFSNIPKLFEKPLFKLLSSLFDKILSLYQCGFRKGFNASTVQLPCQRNGNFVTIKVNLLERCLQTYQKLLIVSFELLIAKLKAYGFDDISFKLMHSHLTGRKQRTKTAYGQI